MTEGARESSNDSASIVPPTGERAYLLPVALMLALYAPLIFLGYGSDNDTFLVLDTGRGLLERQTYQPSRNPGYILFETTVGVLSRVGGSVLCNAATLAAGVASLLLFLRVCRELDVPRRGLLGVLFVAHPVLWVNATCTMDYVWALALLLAGLLLVIRRAYLAAGVVLGLAIAVRSTSFVGGGVVLACALAGRRDDRGKILLAAVIAVLLGALFYVPSFRHAGYTLEFLRPMIGGPHYWTLKLQLGRFVYKNLYFWGLPAAAMLPMILWAGRGGLSDPRRRGLVMACVAGVLAYQTLFLAYPIELGYLLPMVPAVLILLGVGLAHRPGVLVTFAGVLASYALVNLNVARPNTSERATGSVLGLWVEPGFVVQDAQERTILMQCDNYPCWERVTGKTPSTW